MSEWTEGQKWPENASKGILAKAMPDGKVALAIYLVDPATGETLKLEGGILLSPEVARTIAANLTWESMKAEENIR